MFESQMKMANGEQKREMLAEVRDMLAEMGEHADGPMTEGR